MRAGQELFRIDAEGGFEAAIGVPETSIAEITLGMPVTINIGLAQHDGSSDKSSTDRLEKVDTALYAAKKAGRNKVVAVD